MIDYQIVVARYNEDISYLSLFNSIMIIYNKGNNDIPFNYNSIILPNIGRESHTYLYHIINNYDNLANKTLFIQGKIKDHKLLPMVEYFKPGDFIGRKSKYNIDFLKHPIKHSGKYLKELINGSLRRTNYTPYEWLNMVGINITELDDFEMVWGANFCVSKELIHKKPKIFYEHLIKYVDYDINPEEGHIFERSWYLIFNSAQETKSHVAELDSGRENAMKESNHNGILRLTSPDSNQVTCNLRLPHLVVFIEKKIILYEYFDNITDNIIKYCNNILINNKNIEEIHLWSNQIPKQNLKLNLKYINNSKYIQIYPIIDDNSFSIEINTMDESNNTHSLLLDFAKVNNVDSFICKIEIRFNIDNIEIYNVNDNRNPTTHVSGFQPSDVQLTSPAPGCIININRNEDLFTLSELLEKKPKLRSPYYHKLNINNYIIKWHDNLLFIINKNNNKILTYASITFNRARETKSHFAELDSERENTVEESKESIILNSVKIKSSLLFINYNSGRENEMKNSHINNKISLFYVKDNNIDQNINKIFYKNMFKDYYVTNLIK